MTQSKHSLSPTTGNTAVCHGVLAGTGRGGVMRSSVEEQGGPPVSASPGAVVNASSSTDAQEAEEDLVWIDYLF